jgi:hypothetical protein
MSALSQMSTCAQRKQTCFITFSLSPNLLVFRGRGVKGIVDPEGTLEVLSLAILCARSGTRGSRGMSNVA